MEPRPPSERLASIDVAKGLATLWVLLIHADALAGTLPMVHLFNRAAPIFVVLMGVNGALWWRDRGPEALSGWYVSRLRRLYAPMWWAVGAWWVIALAAPQARRISLGPKRLLEHALGYLHGVGTGWFVTLAIAVAIGFPFMVFAARRLGAWTVVAIGVVSTAVTFSYRYQLMHALGLFGWFVFPPRLLAELTFGLALGPYVGRLGWTAGLAAAATCALYAAVPLVLGAASPWALGDGGFGATGAAVYMHRLMDLPITVLVLLASAGIAVVPGLARPLLWLGSESYAMYLGQMLTHNALTLLVGFDQVRSAISPLGYAGLLLCGAIAWVFVNRALMRGWSALGGEGKLVGGAERAAGEPGVGGMGRGA